MPPIYQSQVLDHLGLVAGMFDELGIGAVLDQAIPQDLTKRTVSLGQALKAMVRNGLGFVHQPLDLVPRFFQNKPTERLLGAGIAPAHLNDDLLGRALEALYAYGVTPLYSLSAAQAVQRLGLIAPFAHLDTTSFHVDGRSNSAEPPDAQVMHITPGYSRDHRPDLNQVMLELIVEHQAGMPLLMQPLSGNTNDNIEFGRVVTEHVAQLQRVHQVTYLVADSALYSADTLGKLAKSGLKWLTRVPATLTEAYEVLARADPSTMAPLNDGSRSQECSSSYAGVPQRWLVVYSEARQARVRRSIAKQVRTQSARDLKAFKKLCRITFACEQDARQALEAFAQNVQATRVEGATIRAVSRSGKRGRPPQGTAPQPMGYVIEAALASSVAYHQALLAAKRCCIRATNELDTHALPAHEVLAGYKGQSAAERGFRFLKAPTFLASSLYLKKPERLMALLRVMTVCLLGYAALEYRIRQALCTHQETFPDQKGRPIQHPTARWVFHYFVGIHVLLGVGEQPLVLNLNDQHQLVLPLLGGAYEGLYT